MGKRKSHRHARTPLTRETSNRRKGDVVEDITAALHKHLDAKIDKRVLIDPLDGSPPREIDVLITPHGDPERRTAVECKNEAKPIGIEYIDAFVGKLLHVGIAAGVFVSASGFTTNARKRAKTAGIRLFCISGLANDRLGPELRVAIQSFVHHMLVVESIRIESEAMTHSTDDVDVLRFSDPESETPNYPFNPLDLIYQQWINGNPPSSPGRYKLNLVPPQSWIWGTSISTHPAIVATVRVIAYVGSIYGSAERTALTDPESNVAIRWNIQSRFEPIPRTLDVTPVTTARRLHELLSQPAFLRIELPHVRCRRIRSKTYWPPSDRVHEFLRAAWNSVVEKGGDRYALSQIPFEEIEGTDLSGVWEQIWKDYPSWLKRAG